MGLLPIFLKLDGRRALVVGAGSVALDKIASVDVDQSIPGRLLNFGSVTIVGVGEGSTKTIDTIASPLAFRSAITAH